jgi:hypothetical protein
MNTTALIRHMAHTYATCLRTVRKKNADYSGGNEDAFRTMRLVEVLGICPTEQGILSRIAEKLGRTCCLINGQTQPAVEDEPVDQTLRDIISHCAILIAYRNTKKAGRFL